MFLTPQQLRRMLSRTIQVKREQGYDTAGLDERLAALPDSRDALVAFVDVLAGLPVGAGWPHHEPSDWDGIVREMAPDRPTGPIVAISADEAAGRVEAAFLGSVCGCILGKPLEVSSTLERFRPAFEKIGEWPLNDYVSERVQSEGGLKLHPSWRHTTRGHIASVSPDDDINYTVLGMLVLERHGRGFTHRDLHGLWLDNLAPTWTFGPERLRLLQATATVMGETKEDLERDLDLALPELNPGQELCGAMIRADAYGYACPGDPALAAALAWRDASWTHRKTGIYGTMFAAAAIASAFVVRDPIGVFETALKFVPQNSRFAAAAADAIAIVREANDWVQAYEAIHDRYGAFGHCKVLQETATLVNTLRFAESVGHGVCLQVMQGNDTDSYGATAGSILGAFFGPGHLEGRWLAPFNDTVHTTLANFHEQSLSRLAERMGRLPGVLRG